MAHSFTRWVPITALALMLASCFMSGKPLFTEKEADYPIADGARFSVQSLKQDGTPDATAPQDITIKRDGDFYLYIVKGDEPMKGLMDDMGNGNYIGMSEGEGNLLYGLYQKRGDDWVRHGLNCADFEKLATAHGKSLADFGIEKIDSDCGFTSYDKLKSAVAFEAEFGKPDAIYTPVK